MTRHELDVFRTALIERKRTLTDRVRRLREGSASDSPEAEGEISSVPTHPADLGTDSFEQDKDLGLAERAAIEAQQVDDALGRMKSGRYGICERCGRPISPARLTLLPWAPLCATCQSAKEEA